MFGDDDGKEFIYKEPKITGLAEISHRLEEMYSKKHKDSVKLIMESAKVALTSLILLFTLTLSLLDLNQLPHVLGSDRKIIIQTPKNIILNGSKWVTKRSIETLTWRENVIIACADKQNWPFPSSLVPLFQSESKCETILIKVTFICMKKKLREELIFIWKVSHLDSLWNRGTRELGTGLLQLAWVTWEI